MTEISTFQVLLSLVFVAGALYFSRLFKVKMGKDIVVSAVRAFVQLLAIGYVLDFVFGLDSPLWVVLMIAIMAGVAAYNSGKRGAKVKNSYLISSIAIFFTTFVTILVLSGFGIIPFEAQYIIPVSGMVIGNVMNGASLALMRLDDELKSNRVRVEAALSLGAAPIQAAAPALKKAVVTSMVPVVDRAKVVGIVSLPGGMSGMILAGASPLAAVKFQIVIMYMLLGSPFLTVAIVNLLAYRQYFNRQRQLVLGPGN
ncbi:MAG: iron export ABC transporter permease subunit FetB [Firmicutes bacterium]|nr:iron export ABC transporter permease subunit FetB [Bacillota bacterium]HOB35177.1 iron export ABC transporter permease subunit FetB [Bacillota bacterium]HPZ90428.1 iron export ABC transporter permease subunit FetB [Bacillota bacterium]HQE01668.1 iron export ABC transporter permease subunit FetB [Bacillota bacterium]